MGTPNHVGGVGMGEVVKLVNQIIISNTMLANVEALTFAAKAGADIDATLAVIGTATGANYLLQNWLPQSWLAGSHKPGFMLDLLRKDLAAALDSARAIGVPMPASVPRVPAVHGNLGRRARPRRLHVGRDVLRTRRRRATCARSSRKPMLFGAIDVGTNSIHLIVVELDSAFDTSRVVYKAREMVRLGSDDALESGRLSRKAMERGVEAIARFADGGARSAAPSACARSRRRRCARPRTATSFARMVAARTGLALEILDGNEEARLIHLGVANGYPLYDRVACIIDIGGGSTEFIVADGERPYLVDSVKLGSLRLYDAYLRGKPDPLRAARELDAHIARRARPARRARAPLPARPRARNLGDDHGAGGARCRGARPRARSACTVTRSRARGWRRCSAGCC